MTVRWGVLGAGAICERAMLRAFTVANDAECVAIASRSADRAAALASSHGIATVHPTYEALLADDAIDAVYVGLHNAAHLPLTLAALAAGKHVLCEKPLALSVAEVDEMTAAATAADRLLVEASWYRWHPRIKLAERLLHELAFLGPVEYVFAGFTFPGVPEGNYRLDPALGGGALYDIGCYVASAAVWAFGTEPREVTAKADIGPTGVDLTTTLTVRFDGGSADLRASIAEDVRQFLVVTAERGDIEIQGSPFTAWEGEETAVVVNDKYGQNRETLEPAHAYALMVENVSAVIEGREGWVVPLAESRATAAILDAAFESAAAGTPVAL